MAVERVLLDSDVLFPLPLRDTLLRAAEVGLYDLCWSQQILDDTTRNLVNKGRMTEQRAAVLQQRLKYYFPKAIVEVPAETIAAMTNHPGDRHVAAAAAISQAKIIVTFNLRHFPSESLIPWGIEAQHPDAFLCDLDRAFPNALVKIVRQQSEDLKDPPISLTELLSKLGQQVPEFVNRVQQQF